MLAVALSSAGAARLRVHFRDFDTAAGEVWVYSPGGESAVGPYTGKGMLGTGEFWSAGVGGPTVVIAYLAPTGTTLANLPFHVDALSHQWAVPPLELRADAASCNLDVTCYADYKTIATAIVQYDFIGDATGFAYHCSGAMINTRGSSLVPYLLTAHHCITSDSEAQSMEVHFLYQTSICNGPPPDLSSVPTILGGHYLAGAGIADGDYALVQISAVPSGIAFLGWNAGTLEATAPVASIHHPQGSYKRISLGNRTSDVNTIIGGEIAPAALYYAVDWTSGITEAGSSGAPLLDAGGNVAGTLTSVGDTPGSNACGVSTNAAYGRFGNAYSALRPYLEDAPPPPLSALPVRVAFQVADGVVAAPATRSETISISSGSPVDMVVRSNRSWLMATALASRVSASAPATVQVSIDPASLPEPGTYYGLVSVASIAAAPASIPVEVNVAITRQPISLTLTPNPVYRQAPDAEGNQWSCTIRIDETSGADQTLTGFKIDSSDYSPLSVFGTTTIPKSGFVSVTVKFKNLLVPVVSRFEADGTDANGRAWQVVLRVPFLNFAPTIAAVANAASFQPGSVSGGYIEIDGNNLAPTTASWDRAIFAGRLPTELAGVSVTIGGKPAWVQYVSPKQINVLAPDVPAGKVDVQVTSAGVAGPPFSTTSQGNGPALLSLAGQYPIATHSDYSIVAKAGLLPGVNTVPAKPAEIITFWGIGFGSTTPPAPAGVLVPFDQLYRAAPITVTIGGVNAEVSSGAQPVLSPGFAGLYQFPVQVPASAPDGDLPVKVTQTGVSSPDNVLLTVQH